MAPRRSDFAHLRSKRSRINSWRIYARGHNIPLFIRPCDGLDQPNQNPGRLEIKNKRGVERWEELLGSKHITHQYYLEPGAGAKAEGVSISAVPICHHQWQDRITRHFFCLEGSFSCRSVDCAPFLANRINASFFEIILFRRFAVAANPDIQLFHLFFFFAEISSCRNHLSSGGDLEFFFVCIGQCFSFLSARIGDWKVKA